MSTNGKFEDPVDQRKGNNSPSGPNFFPEQWNGVGDQQAGQPQQQRSTDQQLYDSAYNRGNMPQDTRRQYQDVPPEFQQRPNWSTTDGQGNTYNFFIREAHINMGDRTGFDFRTNPVYDYRQYDQSYQNMNRRINYYDDPYQRMYEQQARMQYIREQQRYQAEMQRQYMYDQWQMRRGGYDYYPQQQGQVYQDGVHGGPDGYSASRTRIGYGNGNNWPGTPPFVPGGGGQRDDFDRFVDLGFGVLDRVFANEANRRAHRNNNDNNYRPQPHYPRPRPQAPPYYGGGQDCYGNNNQGNRRPQFPPGYNDVIRRRGY